MSDIRKAGLLVVNEDATRFLILEDKSGNLVLPGGKYEPGESDIECLRREIKEELACEIVERTLSFFNEYSAPAISEPEKKVFIRLYLGKLAGEAEASAEIKTMHWVGEEAARDPRVTTHIWAGAIPDLVQSGVLK
jgi:8-oxo-dGTP diphosphatase